MKIDSTISRCLHVRLDSVKVQVEALQRLQRANGHYCERQPCRNGLNGQIGTQIIRVESDDMGDFGSIVCLAEDGIQLGHFAEGAVCVIAKGHWNFSCLEVQNNSGRMAGVLHPQYGGRSQRRMACEGQFTFGGEDSYL